MNFELSKTYENLEKAVTGEALANFKYRLYASKASSDGYEQIRDIFLSTAGNEFEHCELFYKKLHGELKDTKYNLFDAALGENSEWTETYKDYASTAKEEGYDDIAKLFLGIARSEERRVGKECRSRW